MYEVIYSKEALNGFRKIAGKQAFIIQSKIEAIAKDPYARNLNITKLQGVNGYRLRVGDWRVIYDIEDKHLIINVIRIASRGSVYKN